MTQTLHQEKWLDSATVSADVFITDYWRKRCIALANDPAIAALGDSLNEQSLLNLAEDELLESRLIQIGTHLDPENKSESYHLSLGPFSLTSLPLNCMLMVQTLETQLPAIAQLLDQQFSFLPRWRIDDVMASFGHAGANCGPHFDHYDVFLLQVRGEKTWYLDDAKHSDSELERDSDLSLLRHFDHRSSIKQVPGDILYVPAGAGHHGLASDDCLTLSIGIRNPTMVEMISHMADMATDNNFDDEDQKSTLDDSLSLNHNGIASSTTKNLSDQLNARLTNINLVDIWFGRYMTELREPEMIIYPDENFSETTLGQMLDDQSSCQVYLYSRLSWHQSEDRIHAFANGQSFAISLASLAWFKALVTDRSLPFSKVGKDKASLELLNWLFNEGAVFV